MRFLITAGPTREYIDDVRFITNASSGRMGCAVAAAARQAGHEVTLLLGPCEAAVPAGCRVESFVSVDDLSRLLAEHFPACDVLVMSAAVGDFRVAGRVGGKISRRGGPVDVRLTPTEDLLASLRPLRRPGQVVVAFAVESGTPEQAEAKARAEMEPKGADLSVVNPPAAMGAQASEACILSRGGVVLPWARRAKDELARAVVKAASAR